jgi:hypothetical protein
MAFEFQFVVAVVLTIWLTVLSILVWKLNSRYNKITKQFSDTSALSYLERLTHEQAHDKKQIAGLLNRIAKIEDHSLKNIQKVGLIRFNPFKDTGGDQSFILALLDAHQSGIVISGLYSRAGTRWYAKRVENGKGSEHELSEEEKKAVSVAK